MGSSCITDEASIASLPLTSCCVAWFLTGHGPAPVWGPGIEDPCPNGNVFCCSHSSQIPWLLAVVNGMKSKATEWGFWENYLKQGWLSGITHPFAIFSFLFFLARMQIRWLEFQQLSWAVRQFWGWKPFAKEGVLQRQKTIRLLITVGPPYKPWIVCSGTSMGRKNMVSLYLIQIFFSWVFCSL